MNSEERDLNQKSDIEVFSLDSINDENAIDTVKDSFSDTNNTEEKAISNSFIYADEVSSIKDTSIDNSGSETNAFTYNEDNVISENSSSVDTVQNTFGYTEFPSASVVEMVPEGESVQNAFEYTETPVALESPVEANPSSVTMETSYTDLANIQQNNVEEVSEYDTPKKANVVSNYNDENQTNQKNNFKFMIIFTIIMLAIIFALPYVAGYK